MATKEYKDLTPKERYDSAIAADKEPWDPVQTAKDLIKEKLNTKEISSKKSEPTFKSDVDYMVSGVKKFDKKIDDTLADPVRKVLSKAAGKEEKGILGNYSKFSRDFPEAKKKGGMIKKMAKGGSVSSASKRADGCCTKGKTKGRIV